MIIFLYFYFTSLLGSYIILEHRDQIEYEIEETIKGDVLQWSYILLGAIGFYNLMHI